MKKIVTVLLLIMVVFSSGQVMAKKKVKGYKGSLIELMKKPGIKIRLLEIRNRIRKFNGLDDVTLEKWRKLIKDLNRAAEKKEIDELVSFVTKDSLGTPAGEIGFIQIQTDYLNRLKNKFRNHLTKLREHEQFYNDNPGEFLAMDIIVFPLAKDVQKIIELTMSPENISLLSGPVRINIQSQTFNKHEWKFHIHEFETRLTSLSEMTASLNLGLKTAKQRYTQAMQVISNIHKTLTDTALTIIRNLR